MKTYCVEVDITMSRNVYVDAESEEEAKQMVLKNITAEPEYYNRGAHCVNVECIDVYEDL